MNCEQNVNKEEKLTHRVSSQLADIPGNPPIRQIVIKESQWLLTDGMAASDFYARPASMTVPPTLRAVLRNANDPAPPGWPRESLDQL